MVYIREAHPSDMWQLSDNIEDKVVFASPKSYEEKVQVGQMCATKLGIEFPTLIDNFDGAVERAYTGWPDRLYLVDRDGRIAYKSAPGPFGFKPSEMEVALKEISK